MIYNCKGCLYELEEAYWQEKDNSLFLTTNINNEYEHKGKHFHIIMVNNKGKVIIW